MNSTHTVVDVCSCKKICTKTQPLRSDNAASTLKGSSEGQIQARLAPRKITERVTCSQSSYTVRPHRRSFDSTATNKPRQYRGHAEEEPTTATITTLPTLLPPSSLPKKSDRHWSLLLKSSSTTKSPRGNTTPRHRHRLIIRSRVSPGEANKAGRIRTGGVRQQLNDAAKKVNDGPQPPPSMVAA